MLYVLTQEELDNLVPKKDLDAGCPVSDIGGDAKTEKERPPSDISSAICPNKRRRYGK
jgi:hypothetical protein